LVLLELEILVFGIIELLSICDRSGLQLGIDFPISSSSTVNVIIVLVEVDLLVPVDEGRHRLFE